MPKYLFREGVDVNVKGNEIVITTPYATRSNPYRQKLHLKEAGAPLKELIKDLLSDGVESDQYSTLQDKQHSASTHLSPESQLKTLYKKGLLSYEIEGCNGTAICLLPNEPGLKQQPCPEHNEKIKLSEFGNIKPCREGLDITTPLSPATLRLQDHRLYQLIQMLASPCTIESIRGFLPEDLCVHNREFISLLLMSEVIGVCNNNRNADIDAEAIESGWSREDLAFHCHTRRNIVIFRRDDSHLKENNQNNPPAKHQRIIIDRVPLSRLSNRNYNSNFYQIIQKRQTIRAYNAKPVSAEALGTLLWYSMHTREEILCDPGLPRSYEGLLRPVASAGALHSIEFYLCIKQCMGISPGFYHYDSFDHSLGKLSDLTVPCENMLALAVNTTCRAPQAASVSPGQAQPPDVLIVMASRYARNASIHSETGLAYALILKDAGSIYQQLYLVATALGLAPCGLSFGSSELFEQASGMPRNVECSVGEFMIGNPK